MSSIGRRVASALAERAGRAYVVGPELADALRACHSLETRDLRSTICFWNRLTDAPRDIADRYLDAIDAIGDARLDCRVSIKAPPLRFSRELVRDVIERARQRDVDIHFDSLSCEASDATFSLIDEMMPIYDRIGCTLPGRWRRSVADAARAADLGLQVRVVKGQWADPREPGIDPRAGFLAVIDRLAGRAPQVAVATHDTGLAREALTRLRAAGTSCELELLFGLPLQEAISVGNEQGVPIRMYLPYGHGALPYFMRQLKRDPRIAWWILRDLFRPATTVVGLPRFPPPDTPRADRSPSR